MCAGNADQLRTKQSKTPYHSTKALKQSITLNQLEKLIMHNSVRYLHRNMAFMQSLHCEKSFYSSTTASIENGSGHRRHMHYHLP